MNAFGLIGGFSPFCFKTLTSHYPNLSPYTFGNNDPIKNIDVKGQFVRDKDGNIIVTITKVKGTYTISGPTGSRDKNGNIIYTSGESITGQAAGFHVFEKYLQRRNLINVFRHK